MEEENIKCNDEEKGTVISSTPIERVDTVKLRKVTLSEVFDVFGTLFVGFVVIYVIFAGILKIVNIWIRDPLLDAPFELIFLVLWIFVPIVIIFAILYCISIKYKIVKRKDKGGLDERKEN